MALKYRKNWQIHTVIDQPIAIADGSISKGDILRVSGDNLVETIQDNYGFYWTIQKEYTGGQDGGGFVSDPILLKTSGYNAAHNTTTLLHNGTIMWAMRLSKGYGVIIDKYGNTSFYNKIADTPTNRTSNTTFANNNVLLAYKDWDNNYYGAYTVIDSENNILSDRIVFNSNTTENTVTDTLTNGNAMIAYRDTADGYGKLAIVDQDGNTVTTQNTFSSQKTLPITISALKNGNAMILYVDWDLDKYGRYIIVTNSGSTSLSQETFYSGNCTGLISTTLSNGNVMVLYKDYSNSYCYSYTIINESGGIVTSNTAVTGIGNSAYLSVDSSNNGYILFAYADENDDTGHFMIIDNSGNTIVSPTSFTSNNVEYVSVSFFDNGSAVIVYQDDTNSGDPTYVLISPYEVAYKVNKPIGISQNNANDGENVYMEINVDENQSGLSSNTTYNVQSDGTLGLSDGPRVGRALDSTRIVLDRG